LRSGKEVLSPAPPPLRTGRASFPASGSSIGKRTLRHAARSHEERPSTLPRRSRQRNRRKLHQQELCTPPTFLHCFLKSVCQTLHVDQHQREVCRLSPWGNVALRLNPYPAHYRPAFACSLIPYPPSRQLPLRVAFPCGEKTGLPRSVAVTVWVRSRLFAGGASTAPEEFGASGPDHVPFGPSVSASCAWPL